MRILRMIVPGAVLAAGLFLTASSSYGTVEISKKEKKGCVTCHTAMGKKDLNAVGKCYKESKSLEGCAKK